MNSKSHLLVVLAGPNGAGKSSFYQRYLASSGLPFLNADVIAKEQFGDAAAEKAREAARLADQARAEFIGAKKSFIFETVLSDPVGDKVAFFAKAQEQGYFLEIHFIGLASPVLSQARVIHRVSQGGHDVPDDKLVTRYPRTMENLQRLLPLADRLTIYDNSEHSRAHRPLAMLERGTLRELSAELPPWIAFLNLPALRTAETNVLP